MARGVTLIGMPGSGKSTLGRMLSKELGWSFFDLDDLIREGERSAHAEIAKEKGDAALLRLEEEYTLRLKLNDAIFSPGGSIVYSNKAMEKLRGETSVVYLERPFEVIAENLKGKECDRGIVGLAEKGLVGVFQEREPLYRRYAHFVLSCGSARAEDLIATVVALVR